MENILWPSNFNFSHYFFEQATECRKRRVSSPLCMWENIVKQEVLNSLGYLTCHLFYREHAFLKKSCSYINFRVTRFTCTSLKYSTAEGWAIKPWKFCGRQFGPPKIKSLLIFSLHFDPWSENNNCKFSQQMTSN